MILFKIFRARTVSDATPIKLAAPHQLLALCAGSALGGGGGGGGGGGHLSKTLTQGAPVWSAQDCKV